MFDIVRSILWSPNKIELMFPYKKIIDPYSFGHGQYNDFLSFGCSFIEYKDHLVKYILAHPKVMREIIINTEVVLSVEKSYIGRLWATDLYVTDKVKEKNIVFSNEDYSVVLDLNLNKKES
jgi:hypothetical protein